MKRLLFVVALLVSLASPAWAQITRDTQKDLGNNGGSTSSLTTSYTVGAGATELIVGFAGDVFSLNDDCSGGGNGVVWNTSETATLVGKRVTDGAINRYTYLFHLDNPTAGTHNIVITCGSTHYIIALAASYLSTGTLDQFTTLESTSTTSYTATLPSVATNAVVVMASESTGNGGLSAGTGTTQVAIDAAFSLIALYESNPVASAGGSINLVETSGVATVRAIVMASFVPAGGGGGGGGSTTTGCYGTLLGAGPCGD